MKHFLDVTAEASVKEYLGTLSDHSLVIYSPTSIEHIDAARHKGTFMSTHAIGKDTLQIEALCTKQRINTVVGLGGGTAIDIAKYIASFAGCEFICIPTILSTNAFATDKVALIKTGAKVTLDAKLADKIILDTTLVTTAGAHNLYGLCDILSIHTALYDWYLADRAGVEKIDRKIYKMSHDLLNGAVSLALKLTHPSNLDIPSLFAMIGESGHITNLYGSGRPESGSEHIFANELERRADIPHGISIAIGITLMSHLQDNGSADIRAALRQIGIMADIADEYDLRETVVSSLESLRPRKNRYTILDKKLPTAKISNSLTDALYTEILGATNEYSHY